MSTSFPHEAVDARALVDAIRGPSPRYKHHEVEAILAQADATTPYLIALLREVADNPREFIEQQDEDFGPLYALVLLAHLREERAHDVLVDLGELPDPTFEAILGGFITEDFDAALLATSGGRTDRIRELVLCRGASEYVRVQAADALAMAVHRGHADREEVLDLLESQLTEEAAPDGDYFWAGIAGAMLDLHPIERAEVIRQACRDDLILSGMFDEEFVDEMLARSSAAATAALAGKIDEKLPDDVHEWMGWWACFNEDNEYQGLASAQHPLPAPPGSRSKDDKAARKKKRKQQKAARKKGRKKR